MEKIIINGKPNTQITEEFSGKAEFFFNIAPKNAKDINAYDAVFFIGADENEIAPWVGANHLRICENETDLLKQIRFFLGIPQKVEIERKFLIERPDTDFLEKQKLCKA